MEAAAFFLLFVLVVSDSSIASSEATQESRKDYQENEILFSPLTETTAKDTIGDVPIVNPRTIFTLPSDANIASSEADTIGDVPIVIPHTIPSDASIASSEAIPEHRKLIYQENEILFSPLTVTTEKDTIGNVPVVNPTLPGTTPIVNPTSPQPPTTIGPPTTTTPITPVPPVTTTPTTPVPPVTTTPTTPEPPATTTPTTPEPPATTTPTTSGGSWCIANSGASQTALQVALDYACGFGGADCSGIQPGGPCYEPTTLRDHASYAFNSYYQKNPIPTSCAFGGTAQLTTTDPSHGSCKFASSSSTPTTPPRTMTPTVPMTPMTPTVPMTPPSTTTPVSPYTPGGSGGTEPTGFDDGSEPTGSPSSAGNISANLLMLIIMNCLIWL